MGRKPKAGKVAEATADMVSDEGLLALLSTLCSYDIVSFSSSLTIMHVKIFVFVYVLALMCVCVRFTTGFGK